MKKIFKFFKSIIISITGYNKQYKSVKKPVKVTHIEDTEDKIKRLENEIEYLTLDKSMYKIVLIGAAIFILFLGIFDNRTQKQNRVLSNRVFELMSDSIKTNKENQAFSIICNKQQTKLDSIYDWRNTTKEYWQQKINTDRSKRLNTTPMYRFMQQKDIDNFEIE